MASSVEVHDLGVTFANSGQPVVALSEVCLNVEPAEVVAIVGPSGCGKSTLLKSICGLLRPTTGGVAVNGHSVTATPPEVGIIFQTPVLMAWRSVESNVLAQIDMRGLAVAPFRERARHMLERVGLAGFEHAYPHQLSGGMQQRVALCRALIHRPPLVLMDEPFGALDALTREQMGLEFQSLWQECRAATILITHSIQEAVFLADRVLIMTPRPGRIVGEIAIALPRPRTLNMIALPDFARLAGQVREALPPAGLSLRDHGDQYRVGI
jgi:NitT/TauT family transport system ATP-binding protein